LKDNEKKWCLKILSIVQDDLSSEPFRAPILDTEILYHQSTKKPMDLETMNDKAQSSGYRSISGFLDDFNLIVNNCRSFNEASSPLFEAANEFEKCWKKTVGKHSQEAMAMTKSTLTLRKLNGLGNAWRSAQAKKEKKNAASSNNRSNGSAGSKSNAKGGNKRDAAGSGDNGNGGKRRRLGSTAKGNQDDDAQKVNNLI